MLEIKEAKNQFNGIRKLVQCRDKRQLEGNDNRFLKIPKSWLFDLVFVQMGIDQEWEGGIFQLGDVWVGMTKMLKCVLTDEKCPGFLIKTTIYITL